MLRTLAIGALVAAAAVAPGCGGGEPTGAGATTTRAGTTTTPAANARAIRASKSALARERFDFADVRGCLSRARTSHGALEISDNPYGGGWGLRAAGGILDVTVWPDDYGVKGAQIGFTANDADARQLVEQVREINETEPASPFRGSPIERRGNVVLFQLTDDVEIRRIIYGCLGGPPYAGDGEPPPEGPPIVPW